MTEARRFSESIKCGHCGNKTQMPIEQTFSQVESHEDQKSGYVWDAGPVYEILTCAACNGVIFRVTHWHDGLEPDDLTYEILYPSPSSAAAPAGLPPVILKEFQAAMQVRTTSANAYGVLLGRLLELVCDDRGAGDGNLASRLRVLSEKNEIPEKLVRIAETLHEFRHAGAHAWVGELTPAELPILDSLCRAILEYVYSAPQLVDEATARLAQLRSQQRKKKQRGVETVKDDDTGSK